MMSAVAVACAIIQDKNGRKMCPLVDDSKPLESFSPYDGCVCVIHTAYPLWPELITFLSGPQRQ